MIIDTTDRAISHTQQIIENWKNLFIARYYMSLYPCDMLSMR